MLIELRIENFAIIDRLELHFQPGLVTFTGETGAGKSIIIDAVETLLGGRADATMIRSGAERAMIEATFHIPPEIRPSIQQILQPEELLDDPDYLNLGREIRSTGRNVARINGRIVSLALLRELAENFVDVHGQSEHLSLLRVREHINLLDRYAGAEDLRQSYAEIFRKLAGVRRDVTELRRAASESARLTDLLTYQINEIEAARLQAGEEDALRAERTRLANAEGLASLAQQALLALDEGGPETPSITDLFGNVLDAFNDIARLDHSQTDFAEQAQDIFDRMSDIAGELRGYLEGIEFNPKRLDQVEERLNLIYTLKRKYGDSIPAVLSFGENARYQLETISTASERIEQLELLEDELLTKLGQAGQALSDRRQASAETLTTELETELVDLRMSGAQFKVDFQQQVDPQGVPLADGRRLAFDATGLDRVEFLIAPNPGEGLKPLVKIASGGETSRLMLALKNVLARADHVSTLIFDEIDQGIGGRVGTIVGQKLWRLARLHQVMCITHLPQLAAFGEQHLQVRKQLRDGRTLTVVEDLHGEKRLAELAQMLGDINEGTLYSAREMLHSTEEMRARSRAGD